MVECLIMLWMVFKWILSPRQYLPSSFYLSSSLYHLYIAKLIRWIWIIAFYCIYLYWIVCLQKDSLVLKGMILFPISYSRWKLNVKRHLSFGESGFPCYVVSYLWSMVDDVWPLLLHLSFSFLCKELLLTNWKLSKKWNSSYSSSS